MGGNMKAHTTYFLRGESTLRQIIAETSQAIWDCPHEVYMPILTKEK